MPEDWIENKQLILKSLERIEGVINDVAKDLALFKINMSERMAKVETKSTIFGALGGAAIFALTIFIEYMKKT